MGRGGRGRGYKVENHFHQKVNRMEGAGQRMSPLSGGDPWAPKCEGGFDTREKRGRNEERQPGSSNHQQC